MSHIVKPPCDDGVIQMAPEPDPNELMSTTQVAFSTAKSHTGTWVLVATILGSSMAFIDGTVVNVALPVLQMDLKATATDVQWVVEAYSLFLAALILVGGSLGDHFGRRRIFSLGIYSSPWHQSVWSRAKRQCAHSCTRIPGSGWRIAGSWKLSHYQCIVR